MNPEIANAKNSIKKETNKYITKDKRHSTELSTCTQYYISKIMQTINSDYVIHFIYFSSMETDINFLLVFSLLKNWSFITWGRRHFAGGSL